ncbi:hypothetical protein C8R45DRAFT_1044592 [Mycena sanguinolenta]|nr:hypothetical protein C8R45DRAFT_1044592 [Mycena sanguinolenta]
MCVDLVVGCFGFVYRYFVQGSYARLLCRRPPPRHLWRRPGRRVPGVCGGVEYRASLELPAVYVERAGAHAAVASCLDFDQRDEPIRDNVRGSDRAQPCAEAAEDEYGECCECGECGQRGRWDGTGEREGLRGDPERDVARKAESTTSPGTPSPGTTFPGTTFPGTTTMTTNAREKNGSFGRAAGPRARGAQRSRRRRRTRTRPEVRREYRQGDGEKRLGLCDESDDLHDHEGRFGDVDVHDRKGQGQESEWECWKGGGEHQQAHLPLDDHGDAA